MSTPVPLPALGESVTEGTVSRWLKQVGDTVAVDEPLVEISTDKVDTEIPSPAAGVLLEILVAEDDTAEVGAVLAVIGDEGEAPAGEDAPAEADAVAAPAAPSTEQEEPAEARVDDAPAQSAPEATPAAETPASGAAEGTEVTLPQLGESVTEGTVSRWLKQVGDEVAADEPLVEISTDKVDTEIPSPAAGTLLEIRVGEDETAQVGAVLAIIGSADAAPAPTPAAPPPAREQAAPQEETNEPEAEPSDPKADAAEALRPVAPSTEKTEPEPAPAAGASEPPKQAPAPAPRASGDDSGYVTPLVRKLAAEHGVELSSVTGTGVGGRIRKQDVLEAAAKAKAAPAPTPEAPAAAATPKAPEPSAAQAPGPEEHKRGTTEKANRLRLTIARRMRESLQVSAQLTATVEVDLTPISRLRAAAKDDFRAREGAGLSYLPFIAKAAVEGLKRFPKLNATIDTDAAQITYAASEDLGVAVDTEKGLLVPVIKDAGDLSVGGLAKKIADLAGRTRANKVTPDELTGGTFTITNYGSAGTLMDTPIINQPQVAILGTGALVKRPMVISDARLGDIIAVRDMMYLSLTYDHRLVDGADAARYLSFVKARLEEGDFGAEFGL